MPEVKDETNPDPAYPPGTQEEGTFVAEVHDRLRQARIAAGYDSARSAARAFGWNEETYKSHENGVRGLRRDVAARYATALRVDVAWLLLGQGRPPRSGPIGEESVKEMDMPLAPQPAFTPIMVKSRDHDGEKLPIYGGLVEGEEGEDLVGYGRDAVTRWLPAPRSVAGVKNAFGMYVVGDSCSPMFHPGDLVWTDPGKPLTRGCGVVVVFADNTATVKIYAGRSRSHYEVEQLHPAQRLKLPRARVSGVYRIVTTDHA